MLRLTRTAQGLPQAAAGLRRLLQGLGPRRQDDPGSTATPPCGGPVNVGKGADSIQSGVASRRRCEVCGSVSPACVWPSEPA